MLINGHESLNSSYHFDKFNFSPTFLLLLVQPSPAQKEQLEHLASPEDPELPEVPESLGARDRPELRARLAVKASPGRRASPDRPEAPECPAAMPLTVLALLALVRTTPTKRQRGKHRVGDH